MTIYHINPFNKALFLLINNLSVQGGPFNNINVFIALYSPLIIIASLIIIYFSRAKNESLYALYAAVFGLFINFIIGLFYYHPRPFVAGLGHMLIHHASDSSFPSDHATLAFSVAFGFLIFNKKLLGIIYLVFAIAVGFARVYTGVHFPFDIFGSFTVSLLSIIIIYISRKPLAYVNTRLITLQVLILKKIRIS